MSNDKDEDLIYKDCGDDILGRFSNSLSPGLVAEELVAKWREVENHECMSDEESDLYSGGI